MSPPSYHIPSLPPVVRENLNRLEIVILNISVSIRVSVSRFVQDILGRTNLRLFLLLMHFRTVKLAFN